MNRVLIAVDDTKGSKNVLGVFQNLVKPPQEVLLLHVQRLEGRSMMIDMLSDCELSTIRESLKGTEYKEKLDRQSEKILNYYRKEFSLHSQTFNLLQIHLNNFSIKNTL